MSFRICRCCGQRMSHAGTAVSLNPNVCVACFALPNEAGITNQRDLPARSSASLHLQAFALFPRDTGFLIRAGRNDSRLVG